ncbi:hypothetical protein ALT1644_640015 [Alteromonas macleodii]
MSLKCILEFTYKLFTTYSAELWQDLNLRLTPYSLYREIIFKVFATTLKAAWRSIHTELQSSCEYAESRCLVECV